MTFQHNPNIPVQDIGNDQQFGVKSAQDRNEQVALILNAQTRFAALDATEVQGYVLVVRHKPNEAGEVFTTVEAGGGVRDKINMLNTLVTALKKQLVLADPSFKLDEPKLNGIPISEVFKE